MLDALKISVVLTTYNGAKYIDAQIASIVEQQRVPDQIVISDDHSSDDTWSKLEEWKSAYPHLIEIYQQNPNIGLNNNFNFVLSKATGDYIAIADQDDIWYPNKLDVLEKAAQHHPQIMLFHHSEDAIDSDGNLQPASDDSGDHWLPFEGRGVGLLFVYNRLTGHLLFFKKELLTTALPIPSPIIYDWWLNVNVASLGTTEYIPEKLMQYRHHSESAYFSNVGKQLSDVTEPIRVALTHFVQIPSLSNEDKKIGNQFLRLYEKHQPHQFDWSMFWFLFRHRKQFFRDYIAKGSKLRKEIFIVRLCRAFSKW